MKNHLPLVSVIVPAYNHGKYVGGAVQSILDQDYPNVELIVIDDGSTDNTRQVLKEFGDKFHWETQQNAGQARTLNRGWAMSNGDVLSYLSPDDVLRTGAVRKAVDYLLKNPGVAMVYGDYVLIDELSRFLQRVVAPDFDYTDMATKLVCPPGPGPFFRREIFERIGGWNPSYSQIPDYEYWLRLGLVGEVVRIPHELASFRVHEGSASFRKVPPERSEECSRVMREYFARKDVPLELLTRKKEALSNGLIFEARLHLRSGRYSLGVRKLQEGLRLYPPNFSARTARVVAHGLLNHIRHRLRLRLRSGGHRKEASRVAT